MKRFNLWLLLSLFISAFMFTACSSSDDATSGDGEQGGGGDVLGVTTGYTISGVVKSGMAAMSGVKVTAGTASVITGANGMFYLENVGGSVVKFEKEGYATITRAISADATYEVSMTSVQTDVFPATSAKTLNVGWSGMQVDLPASFKDESGNAYTGSVTAKSAYLDPQDGDFAVSMPGDLTAIRSDQSEAALVSYGMIAVELTGDAGQKLQPGEPAKLTFPVGSLNMKITPSNGDKMPLWSFNEETGLWEEEGEATYDASLQAYVGNVAHFSWHNLDYPYSRATLDVKVIDANGTPLPNIMVDYDGQRFVRTNSQGIATCTVPSGTPMVIRIPSESYCYYADVINEYGYSSTDETKIIKKENVTLTAGTTETITFTMPSSSVISGKVVNERGTAQPSVLWIEYGYNSTASVITDNNGQYKLYAPYGYTGAAKIVAFCGDGNTQKTAVTLNGTDQTVDITVNGSSTSEAGYAYVKGNGVNLKLDLGLPETGVFDNAVNVSGGSLSAYTWGGQAPPGLSGIWNVACDVFIPEYDETKTSFMGTVYVRWAVMKDMGEDWYHVSSSQERTSVDTPVTYVPIEVVKVNDIYIFKISDVNAYYGVDAYSKEPTESIVKLSVTFSAK